MDILQELKRLIINADNYEVRLDKEKVKPQDISAYKLGFIEGGVIRIIKDLEKANGN